MAEPSASKNPSNRFQVSKPPSATSEGLHAGESLLHPEEHVLSTLEMDGSRRWLFPRLAPGFFWQRRRIVAYFLIAIFAIIPHLRVNGKPMVLLDIAGRRFTLLGYTFLPTDTLLLALLMVSAFVSIFFTTALFGRVWCGWGCPQSVFMEFVYRPIDRLFQGTKGKGGKPSTNMPLWKWWLRAAVYLVVCMFLAHTFLAYFVGVEQLSHWIRRSPFEHPQSFIIMAVTVSLMMFDFLYFREQTCLIVCPYGRFQSVMLDRRSLIVTYDGGRGEPRGRKAKEAEPKLHQIATETEANTKVNGDCVDCHMCVQVCPTGIDIRNGLQMECLHCAQCIDVCDSVMEKLDRPKGLIRYSNQDAIEKKPSHILRPRLLIYPLILSITLSAFMFILFTKKDFDAKLFRNVGNSFSSSEVGIIDNSLKLFLTNRTDEQRAYSFEMISPNNAHIRIIDTEPIVLEGGIRKMVAVLVSVPFTEFDDAHCDVQLRVRDDKGEERILPYKLLGPYQLPQGQQ